MIAEELQAADVACRERRDRGQRERRVRRLLCERAIVSFAHDLRANAIHLVARESRCPPRYPSSGGFFRIMN